MGGFWHRFEHRKRVRCNGVASIVYSNPLKSAFPEAQFVVRVRDKTREML